MGDPVMYSQLQQWNKFGSPEAEEDEVPPGVAPKPRVSFQFETPRPHPWRPILGYESAEIMPLPSQPLTNSMMDPCYSPAGMATPPLKFANLITGFDSNPAHAARAALYTRYTPHEWKQNNTSLLNESNTIKSFSEKLRANLMKDIKQTDELTDGGQRDTSRKIGERITDMIFWRNELAKEMQKLLVETDNLQEKKNLLERTIHDIQGVQNIAQECLYHRENRLGMDLVHDNAEQTLLREAETLKNTLNRLNSLQAGLRQQLINNRAAQHELETDIKNKENALGIDNMCRQINNYTKGIEYYGGIENYDPTVCDVPRWLENCKNIIKRSQQERMKSTQTSEIDGVINSCANDVWVAWNETNNALTRKCAETLDAKNKLLTALHKIQIEMFNMEKSMELLRKTLYDKNLLLKVAHTRLEARMHRRGLECAMDDGQKRLIKEVKDIQNTINFLNQKLSETEAQHQQLSRTKSNLESDLQSKVNTLFIDREKCLGLRRSYPVTTTIRY